MLRASASCPDLASLRHRVAFAASAIALLSLNASAGVSLRSGHARQFAASNHRAFDVPMIHAKVLSAQPPEHRGPRQVARFGRGPFAHRRRPVRWSALRGSGSGPNPALKGTPRVRGFATAPGSPLACIR